LRLALVLVDKLLLVVYLITTFLSSSRKLLIPEVLNLAFAFGNHLPYRFSLDVFVVQVLIIELLLSVGVILELVFHGLGTLKLRNVHIVASVLHVFAALLLAFKSLVASLTLLFFSLLNLDLISHETLIVSFAQIYQLIGLLSRLLNLLLRLFVLHLEHAHSVAKQFHVIFHLVLHSFDVVYCSWTLRHSLLLTLAGHKLTYPTIEFFLVWHRV